MSSVPEGGARLHAGRVLPRRSELETEEADRVRDTEVEIVGIPDFIIRDNGGHRIRDAKMARRIDDENHPEIGLQVGLYGWLYEQTTGHAPKKLEVFSGTETVVDVPYDGGRAALDMLARILQINSW